MDELDALAKSFAFGEWSPFPRIYRMHSSRRAPAENCKQRTRLNEYLMEDSKRTPEVKRAQTLK